MNQKLIVIKSKNADGSTSVVKKSTRKPGWGSVAVMLTILTISNGIINSKKRIGFVRAQLPQLDLLALQEGQDFNARMLELGGKAHKIVVKETTVPQYEGHKAKINPTTKAVMKALDGSPIFYATEVVEDNEANQDSFITAQASAPAVVGIEAGEIGK